MLVALSEEHVLHVIGGGGGGGSWRGIQDWLCSCSLECTLSYQAAQLAAASLSTKAGTAGASEACCSGGGTRRPSCGSGSPRGSSQTSQQGPRSRPTLGSRSCSASSSPTACSAGTAPWQQQRQQQDEGEGPPLGEGERSFRVSESSDNSSRCSIPESGVGGGSLQTDGSHAAPAHGQKKKHQRTAPVNVCRLCSAQYCRSADPQ
jgi:hypothetical protein